MQDAKKSFRFMLQTLFHPIKGFYEMKMEKKGRMWIAVLGVLLYGITTVFTQQTTAFLFNPIKYQNPDLFFSLTQAVVICVLFCVGNWSVTCLMDGEGSFKDILMVFGYACYPLVFVQVPLAVVSNVCTFGESSLITLVTVISYIWFVYLLFFGVMTVHQYTLGKMLTTTILTLCAMLILVFLYLLFFSFISRIVAFVIGIYKEVSFRLL